MFNILVTGSNGQLGNELKHLVTPSAEYTFHFHDIDTLDITSQAAVNNFFEKHPVQLIVNCAAYTAVDKAESEQGKAYLVNQKAVNLLDIVAKKYNCKIIHISTDYVFNGTKYTPYKESDKTNPDSVYGKSKLEGEKALTPDNSIIIRTSWLYSSFGNNFVKTMLRLCKERDEIKVIFDQTGTPTYAKDLAETILLMVSYARDDKFYPGIYHYSNEGVTSWYDFAKAILAHEKANCHVIPIETHELPMPAKRPFYSVLNKKKIKDTYNITIPYWQCSLNKCLDTINP